MRNRKGFTLMEMILVVVIIGLLAALVVPRLVGKAGQAKESAALAQVQMFKQALNQFELDCGRFPTTAEGLRALVEKPPALPDSAKWTRYPDQPFVPKDPWGNDFVYRQPGRVNTDGYDLFSPGPDGRPDTEDDIGNTREPQ